MMITPSAKENKEIGAAKEESATNNKKAATSSTRHWSSAGFRNPRIVRVSRSFGGKDRHSKVCTVRGLRDRRIRLSVPTAVQLYDLQDRLGLGQPSKVIDWLIDNTKPDIDNLPPLHFPPQFHHNHNHNHNNPTTKPVLNTDDFSFFPHKNLFSSYHNHHHHQLGLGQLGVFPQIIDSSSASASASSSSLSPSLFFGGQLANPIAQSYATDHQTTMMMMMIGHDQSTAAARSTSSPLAMINVINNNNNNNHTSHVLQNYSLMPSSSANVHVEDPSSSSIRSIFNSPRFLSHGGFGSRHGKDHHG